MFKTRGGKGKVFLNNVQNNCNIGWGGHPSGRQVFHKLFLFFSLSKDVLITIKISGDF